MKSSFTVSKANPESTLARFHFRAGLLAVFFIFLFLSLSACKPFPNCTDPLGCWYFQPSEEIGLATDESPLDPAHSHSLEIQRGLELFIAAHPDAFGHPLKLVVFPLGCYPQTVQTDFKQLSSLPGLFAFIGPACRLETKQTLRTVDQAGILTISPLPIYSDGELTRQLLLTQDLDDLASSARQLLANLFPAQTLGWVSENTTFHRQLMASLCPAHSDPGYACLDPVYLDGSITRLGPYLSPPLLAQAGVWIFLTSPQNFTSLNDLQDVLSAKKVSLLTIENPPPETLAYPLDDFFIIAPAPLPIPPEFTLSYEKRYNGQHTATAYKAYQAAEIIIQALEKTAIQLPDQGLLLPRQSFVEQAQSFLLAPSGLCIYPVRANHLDFQELECP